MTKYSIAKAIVGSIMMGSLLVGSAALAANASTTQATSTGTSTSATTTGSTASTTTSQNEELNEAEDAQQTAQSAAENNNSGTSTNTASTTEATSTEATSTENSSTTPVTTGTSTATTSDQSSSMNASSSTASTTPSSSSTTTGSTTSQATTTSQDTSGSSSPWFDGHGHMHTPEVVGTVAAINGNALTVIGRGIGSNTNASTTFIVFVSNATVNKDGNASSTNAIKVGDKIKIEGFVISAVISATAIDVNTATSTSTTGSSSGSTSGSTSTTTSSTTSSGNTSGSSSGSTTPIAQGGGFWWWNWIWSIPTANASTTPSPITTPSSSMMNWFDGEGHMHTPTLFGTVTAISGHTITVSGRGVSSNSGTDTTFTVNVASSSIEKDGSSSTLSNVHVGDLIAVEGTITTATVSATGINVGTPNSPSTNWWFWFPFALSNFVNALPQGNGDPVVGGMVTAKSGSTLTIKNEGNKTFTVNTASSTVNDRNGTSTLSQVLVGDKVIVQGAFNGTSVTATSIMDVGASTTTATTTSQGMGGFMMGGFMGGIGGFFQRLFGFF